jgi:hypothetical protein
MVRIIQIDKDGKEIGEPRFVKDYMWENLQEFGKRLRWKEKKEVIKNKKGKNEKKRRDTGSSAKKARRRNY